MSNYTKLDRTVSKNGPVANCYFQLNRLFLCVGDDDQKGALTLLFQLLCVQLKKGEKKGDMSYLFSQYMVCDRDFICIAYRGPSLIQIAFDLRSLMPAFDVLKRDVSRISGVTVGFTIGEGLLPRGKSVYSIGVKKVTSILGGVGEGGYRAHADNVIVLGGARLRHVPRPQFAESVKWRHNPGRGCG